MKDLGIYIHIPFCKSKCFYCDFYSKPECTNSNIEEYIDTICMELLANSELLQERNITTVYFGGGTPSLIDAKYIAKILDIIRLFNNSIEEITIEANPESLTKEKLTAYLEAGVNRLSLGLQSANNSTLKKLMEPYMEKHNSRRVNVEELKLYRRGIYPIIHKVDSDYFYSNCDISNKKNNSEFDYLYAEVEDGFIGIGQYNNIFSSYKVDTENEIIKQLLNINVLSKNVSEDMLMKYVIDDRKEKVFEMII